jgi:ribosomal protein L18
MMMHREPEDPRLALISLRRELIAQGLNDRAIGALVGNGSLHRLRYGAYVDATSWQACDLVGRHGLVARAALKRAQAAVVVSHTSALGEWDVPIWDMQLGEVHLTRVDRLAGRREAGVIQHLGELRDGDVMDLNGIKVTSATRTALDCATVMDTEHAVTVVNDLLYRKLTSVKELAEGQEFMTKWPGSLRHGLVLQLADGRCGGSVGEGRTLYLIFRQGLPMAEPQFPIKTPAGNVFAYVDFAWPEYGVFLEFDGRIKYQELLGEGESPTDVVLREKKRQDRIERLTGWRCIRITWADLYHPERTAALIRHELFNDRAATN